MTDLAQYGLELTAPPLSVYPRLRYMGSKYRLLPELYQIFAELEFDSALDAFSGSGVVGYLLKTMGKRVTTNDFLHFSAEIAMATIQNASVRLSEADVSMLIGPARDERRFIQDTFHGLYFSDEDHRFLDSAWSHIDHLPRFKRAIAISGLCLAAARKQPRGVFTITDLRYDDGRRALRLPLRELFIEAVAAYNAVVFDNGQQNIAGCSDVFAIDSEYHDLVYLDPPYAPPTDDNCYIKRYHFLEGLSVYWRDQEILYDTNTRKLAKRFTPFSYRRTIHDALERLFEQFADSIIVLSYSSNSVPSADQILTILRRVKPHVRMVEIPHRYSFGTHAAARRRAVTELVFIGE